MTDVLPRPSTRHPRRLCLQRMARDAPGMGTNRAFAALWLPQ